MKLHLRSSHPITARVDYEGVGGMLPKWVVAEKPDASDLEVSSGDIVLTSEKGNNPAQCWYIVCDGKLVRLVDGVGAKYLSYEVRRYRSNLRANMLLPPKEIESVITAWIPKLLAREKFFVAQ